MSSHFCVNCGKGAKDLPVEVLPSGVKVGRSEPDPDFDDSDIVWMKVKTSNKLAYPVYVYVCSPKCCHDMEEFFAGGGIQCVATEKDGMTPWEPVKSHL